MSHEPTPAAASSWGAPAVRLAGRLVVLEPLADTHEQGLWEAAQDPRIWRWFTVTPADDRRAFRAWFEDALARTAAGGEAAFATLDAAVGAPIGSTRFMNIRPEHRVLEIGSTWLTPAAWGSGANTEAKLLLLEHAFERLGARRVEFKTEATNERSRAALAALPARFEGIFRKHMLVRDGVSRDSAWYAIVDDEWEQVKAALVRRLDRLASDAPR